MRESLWILVHRTGCSPWLGCGSESSPRCVGPSLLRPAKRAAPLRTNMRVTHLFFSVSAEAAVFLVAYGRDP